MPTPPDQPASIARIADLRDGVAAVLRASWRPADPDGVESVWLARLSFDENDPGTLTTGRRLFVMAADPRVSALSRAYWKNAYTLGVLLTERYTGTGDPPDEWVDALVTWWEQTVFYPLCNPRLRIAGPEGIVTQAVPDPETPPEVTTFVDRDLLTECKAVMIAANFTYIDASNHAGA